MYRCMTLPLIGVNQLGPSQQFQNISEIMDTLQLGSEKCSTMVPRYPKLSEMLTWNTVGPKRLYGTKVNKHSKSIKN